ncbi:hypothetical protein MAR_005620 [Mya arenaria]|uniref:Uncharacterized protein n=1 Tax=Mya arenaria TaxID=6604 RepID=A0ABY7F008_MYAAR|nr:hypothetical protein MAR_005620 [Mya arenaria]
MCHRPITPHSQTEQESARYYGQVCHIQSTRTLLQISCFCKDKGYKNIFVNEDLTRERSRLLFLARQQVKSKRSVTFD